MASGQDYYSVLGVAKGASDAEIKAAYRKAALQWHPDRNKEAGSAEKFKEVTEAYEVLSDPQKKQNYDQFGHDAFRQGAGQGPFGAQGGPFGGQQQGPFSYSYRTYGGGGQQNPFEGGDFGGFSDPFEIFEQFFGGGFGPSASGSRGRVRRQVYSLQISFMEAVKGTEKTVDIAGKQKTIKIPSGLDDGSRVRFDDFDLVISVRPDKVFQREGLDIFISSEVSFPDAALGTTINVATIDGNVELKVPAGTQPDTLIRLRGRGVKAPQSNRVGDQYVKVKVTVPNKLSSDQRKLLEEFQNSSNSSKKRSGWF